MPSEDDIDSIKVEPRLTGFAAGRLFEVPGGHDEMIVACPYEYQPQYDTWRCVVIVGSTMYPQGGYDVIVPQREFRDEKEMFPVFRRAQTSSDKPPIASALEEELHDMHPQVAQMIYDRLCEGPVSFDITSDRLDKDELMAIFSEMGIPVTDIPPKD